MIDFVKKYCTRVHPAKQFDYREGGTEFKRTWMSKGTVSTMVRNRHFFILDLSLLVLATIFAFALRLNLVDTPSILAPLLFYVVLSVFVRTVALFYAGIYQRYWPFATADDLRHLLLAVGVATFMLQAIVFVIGGIASFPNRIPYSIPVIEGLLSGAFLAIARLAVHTPRRRQMPIGRRRVLVVGAGKAGMLLLSEVARDQKSDLEVIGFIDDDSHKHGLLVQGVPVLGNTTEIPQIAQAYAVDEVIIAMPSASGSVLRTTVKACELALLPVRTLPSITELASGRVTVNILRPVQIEDLLRRQEVPVNLTQLGAELLGRTVAVTGAGGSIGSELCRQLAQVKPKRVLLIGHGEYSIYEVHRELSAKMPEVEWVPCILDVRNASAFQTLFLKECPSAVFHAAAHKHVPMMEANVCEAILNNVLGTQNIVRAALTAEVPRFVFVSTDKAVNPTSVMGASKRVAELVVQMAAHRFRRPYTAVRFGNVLGSSGSVVPLFREQIAQGGPITITDPEITRYFMTIPEAAQLVLQASTLCSPSGGDIFVLDMGEPIRIVDLATDLIRLSGLKLGSDIEIRFTGLRPGEKMHEELFITGENSDRTQHPKIMRAWGQSYNGTGHFDTELEGLLIAAQRNDEATVRAVLHRLLPEYRAKESFVTLREPMSAPESHRTGRNSSVLPTTLLGDYP
jgi:FlaA1/EpsC-like NDP-sugar epimerase